MLTFTRLTYIRRPPRTLVPAVLAIFLLLLSSSGQGSLLSYDVTVNYLYPNATTVFESDGTKTVTAGGAVFPTFGSVLSTVVTPNGIVISNPSSITAQMDAVSFSGLQYLFPTLPTGMAISGVTIDPTTNAPGFDTSRIFFSGREVRLNLQGLYLFPDFNITLAIAVPVTMSLSQSTLNFGISDSSATDPQTITINFTSGTALSWTAASNKSNITVSPASGVGNGSIQISATAGASGIVTVTATGATNSPQQVQVNVASVTPSNPFGSFDTPMNNTTGAAGAIPVTGWALDNIGVTKVDLWREPVTGEAAGVGPNGLVYIGDAVFVVGARPDVQAAYPNVPFNYRAGWGYLMLTNFLPNNNGGVGGLGNGTYKLHAIAHNKAGLLLDLGTRAISADNAHASKPFGTIDTPGQGTTISGKGFVNFGWALTQNPYKIATDGSTITAYIDGVLQPGHITYNNFRSDIATLFPGYANSNGAVGYYMIDTTLLANGVHTIFWITYDNQNRGDGLGSRYFSVFNTGTAVAAPEQELEPADGVTLWRDFDPKQALELLQPDQNGDITIEVEELERIELHVGAKSAYSPWSGERGPLPIGSSLKGGVFYWHLGPGFTSTYSLVFERPDGKEIPVKIRVRPKSFPLSRH